jgi:hypothetical protein
MDKSTTQTANGQTDNEPRLPINIPQGADLETPPQPETKTAQGFPDAIFNDLPDVLKNACNVLTEQTEKEVFLVGAFAVISGILPNVRGFYDGGYTCPNLFAYIIGQYGTGKGGLKLAYKLAQPIHAKRREISKDLQRAYKQKCITAKENGEDEPENPGNKMLYIPANNSKSGIVENLADNDGAGVLFETEGDTLADAIKTDYGGFSDILRKGFHQEPISFFRRVGREFREIETPRLSVVLTSTPDQYQKLIPNIQNGLFSRFLHYRLSPNRDFKDVFDPAKNRYQDYFNDLGQTFLNYYETLEGLENGPILFDLRDSQKAHFLTVFRDWKTEVGEYVSTDLDGTVNRLGLICFRLSMILTALRNFEQGDYSETMLCDDVDFYNALRIVELLKGHAIAVFYDLPNPAMSRDATKYETELSTKAATVARAQLLKKQHKTFAEIATALGESKTNIYRWLTTK